METVAIPNASVLTQPFGQFHVSQWKESLDCRLQPIGAVLSLAKTDVHVL